MLDKLGEFGGALRACDDVDQEIATVSAVPPTMVADVELARGLILGHSGAFTEAEAAAYRAIESVDADPESVIVARSGMLLGAVAWKQGRLVDAEQHIRASQTVAERIGDQNGMALCAINLALLLNDGSNHTERPKHSASVRLPSTVRSATNTPLPWSRTTSVLSPTIAAHFRKQRAVTEPASASARPWRPLGYRCLLYKPCRSRGYRGER